MQYVIDEVKKTQNFGKTTKELIEHIKATVQLDDPADIDSSCDPFTEAGYWPSQGVNWHQIGSNASSTKLSLIKS